MALLLPRRGLLLGVAALIAAPAVVRAGSLMRIKPLQSDVPLSRDMLRWAMDSAGLREALAKAFENGRLYGAGAVTFNDAGGRFEAVDPAAMLSPSIGAWRW